MRLAASDTRAHTHRYTNWGVTLAKQQRAEEAAEVWRSGFDMAKQIRTEGREREFAGRRTARNVGCGVAKDRLLCLEFDGNLKSLTNNLKLGRRCKLVLQVVKVFCCSAHELGSQAGSFLTPPRS